MESFNSDLSLLHIMSALKPFSYQKLYDTPSEILEEIRKDCTSVGVCVSISSLCLSSIIEIVDKLDNS